MRIKLVKPGKTSILFVFILLDAIVLKKFSGNPDDKIGNFISCLADFEASKVPFGTMDAQ